MENAGQTQPTPLLPRPVRPVSAARRHRSRQRVLLAVAVLVVGGGGAAGGIIASGSSPGSSYVATRPIRAALVKSPLVGAGQTHGRALVQLGVPTILRYVPGATFAIAVIVTNRAAAPITLHRAAAVLPRHSPLRQIGTRLVAFTPFVCPPGANCPFRDPIGPAPYGVPARPLPLSVDPGHDALAQLHFRFASCWSKSLRARAMPRTVTVAYRTPNGVLVHQLLRLGDSTPQLTGAPVRGGSGLVHC
jgi:hypothetical protein